jgi:hypothetical protein
MPVLRFYFLYGSMRLNPKYNDQLDMTIDLVVATSFSFLVACHFLVALEAVNPNRLLACRGIAAILSG